MPISSAGSSVFGSPLRVSLIRTSRMAGRSLELEGAVAGDRRGGLLLVMLAPGGRNLVSRRDRFATGPVGARLDLLLGRLLGPLLALLGLPADAARLGLELVPGTGAGRLLGLPLEFGDQLTHPVLRLPADLLGALHDLLLDLALEPDRDRLRLLCFC